MDLSREGIIDTPPTQSMVANAMHDNINKSSSIPLASLLTHNS